MTLTISENIRRMRTESGLTQEQLAENVGVSAQAVSRWENGSSYPDITLLPVLANYFGISTDTLLGADTAKKQEEVNKILEHIKEFHRNGQAEESISYIRNKLREFPDSADITYQLAYSLNKKINTLSDNKEVTDLTNEVIDLCKRAIKLDGGRSWITHACRQKLCFSFVRLGKAEKAREIAESMPTWWLSREYMILYTMGPDEAAEQQQHNLLSLMDMMLLHFHKIARDMQSDEQSIEVLDKAISLADMVTGGDHKFYDERVFKCLLWKARYYCRMGNPDSAFEVLEKALFHADRYENRPARSKYNAFWLYRIEDIRANALKDQPETLHQHLLRQLAEKPFEPLHSDSRYNDFINKIKSLILK